MLNFHCYQLEDCFFNSVTKKQLPLDSSEEELRANFFLAGQEIDSMTQFLFCHKKELKITICPTWECTLRCSHCCVLEKLVEKDDKKINTQNIKNFIDSFIKKYDIRLISISFIGGEPLKRPIECLDIIKYVNKIGKENNIDVFSQTTSNFTIGLNNVCMDFLKELSIITVSLDGIKEFHNSQRKPFSGNFDPFDLTLSNIRKVIDYGIRENLRVQSAIREDSGANTIEAKKEYYRILLLNGVLFENISYNVVFPTMSSPDYGKYYENTIKKYTSAIPCCRYRYMNNFVFDTSDNIYIDYLDNEKTDSIGTLSGLNLKELENNFKKTILNKMPVFTDENCTKCPVVAMCWGGCVNAKCVRNVLKPSENCSKEHLINLRDRLVEKNDFVNTIVNFESVLIEQKNSLAKRNK